MIWRHKEPGTKSHSLDLSFLKYSSFVNTRLNFFNVYAGAFCAHVIKPWHSTDFHDDVNKCYCPFYLHIIRYYTTLLTIDHFEHCNTCTVNENEDWNYLVSSWMFSTTYDCVSFEWLITLIDLHNPFAVQTKPLASYINNIPDLRIYV